MLPARGTYPDEHDALIEDEDDHEDEDDSRGRSRLCVDTHSCWTRVRVL